jgi:hypothetical protein
MTKQDIDLQKIQILESYYQGWFNFKASLIAGAVVGTLILIATIEYEKIIPLLGFFISWLIIMVLSIYVLNDMKKDHEKHVSFINELIEKIEKGERLDSIEKLRKSHKDNYKTKTRNDAKT